MNKEEQIKTLAELDGNLIPHTPTKEERDSGSYYQWEPPYLTSRDAIIPLIEKQIKDWKEFTYVLNEQVMKLKCRPLDMNIAQLAEMFIKATPQQLSEALLRATGRWQETK